MRRREFGSTQRGRWWRGAAVCGADDRVSQVPRSDPHVVRVSGVNSAAYAGGNIKRRDGVPVSSVRGPYRRGARAHTRSPAVLAAPRAHSETATRFHCNRPRDRLPQSAGEITNATAGLQVGTGTAAGGAGDSG
jgi:hypothetical protein